MEKIEIIIRRGIVGYSHCPACKTDDALESYSYKNRAYDMCAKCNYTYGPYPI